ncbi:MAG: response regulator transcription factor [Sphaerochaetaceae bacterium]
MKLLIVDDEKPVRESIKLLIDGQQWGISDIFEAENGDKAIEIIKQIQPELVFTDIKMPVKDGLGLIDWIAREFPSTKVIVISGYGDFEYVRQSMKNGAFDYLLKPIQTRLLYDILDKAIQAYEMERLARVAVSQKNERLATYESSYLEKVMLSLLDHEETAPEEGVVQLFQTPFSLIEIDVSLIPFSCPVLLVHDVVSFLQKLIGDNGVAFSRGVDSKMILVLVYGNEQVRGRLTTWILHRLEYLLGGKALYISSGAIALESPSLLLEAVRSMEAMLASRNIWIPVSSEKVASDEMIPRFWDKTRMLSLQSLDTSQIERGIGEWIDSFLLLEGPITVRRFLVWWSEYCIDFQRIVEELHLSDDYELHDHLFAMQKHPLPVLSPDGVLSLTSLRSIIADDLALLQRCTKKKNLIDSNLFHQMAEYIRQHSAEEISLDKLSSLFDRNATYISRRFKKVVGKSVVDYLTDIRIHDAQTLLMNEDLKILEIAESVGYRDEKYFMRLFKRKTGFTPYEYKKNQQKH